MMIRPRCHRLSLYRGLLHRRNQLRLLVCQDLRALPGDGRADGGNKKAPGASEGPHVNHRRLGRTPESVVGHVGIPKG